MSNIVKTIWYYIFTPLMLLITFPQITKIMEQLTYSPLPLQSWIIAQCILSGLLLSYTLITFQNYAKGSKLLYIFPILLGGVSIAFLSYPLLGQPPLWLTGHESSFTIWVLYITCYFVLGIYGLVKRSTPVLVEKDV